MSTNFDENAIDKIINLIKNSPRLREKLLDIVRESDYDRKDEISSLLEEIKELRLDFNKRFEASDKHFESINSQFEASDKQLKAIDKRFDRFEMKMDYHVEKLCNKFDEMTISLDHDFEEFNTLWLQDFLRLKNYPVLKIKKKTFVDLNYEVFSDSKEVEIDIFNEDPLILGEIMEITKSISKVTLFIRKINFLTKLFGEPKDLFFITYGFKPNIKEKAMKLLEQANVKIYTVRQKDVQDFLQM